MQILVLIGLYFLKRTKFDQLIPRKIIKIVPTRCQILMVKCTEIDFGWGSDPDPAGGAYSSPPDHLAGYKGATSLPTCLLLTHVAVCQRVRGVIARARYINVLTCILTFLHQLYYRLCKFWS